MVVKGRALSLVLFFLVCGDGDGAVGVQHHLGTADYGHQQEEAEQEEEEESEAEVHVHIEAAHGQSRKVHVGKSTLSQTNLLCSCLLSGLLLFHSIKVALLQVCSSSEGLSELTVLLCCFASTPTAHLHKID